jgi:hypothetical protein
MGEGMLTSPLQAANVIICTLREVVAMLEGGFAVEKSPSRTLEKK